MSFKSATVIEWLLRVALGGLFIWAGLLKLRDPAAFALDIANYHFLPRLAPMLAASLPMIEIMFGLGVLVAPPLWRRGAALGIALLCVVFTIAIVQALARHIDVACGCFGAGSSKLSPMTALRDLILIGGALLLHRLSATARGGVS